MSADQAAGVEPNGARARRREPWMTLGGAWLVVPALVTSAAALVTAGLSCDANGLVVLVPAPVAGLAGGWLWAKHRRARGWLLAIAVVGAGALTLPAAAFAWFVISFDRCFVF